MTPIEIASPGLPGTVWDPLYPSSDGRFMGESYLHNLSARRLIDTLELFFAGCLDVFVAMNIVFYFERGNPSGRRDPDVLVARGVRGNHPRISYRLWEEGVLPCTLFEFPSEDTWQNDMTEKRFLYARLGVPEYFVFDADGKWIDPVLQGFRLENGQSVPMVPDSSGALVSEHLEMKLIPEGNFIRLVDLRTGKQILSPVEQADEQRRQADEQRRQANEQRRQADEQRRRADQLAAEIERLRAELLGQTGPDAI